MTPGVAVMLTTDGVGERTRTDSQLPEAELRAASAINRANRIVALR
jgi:hypothetical protein